MESLRLSLALAVFCIYIHTTAAQSVVKCPPVPNPTTSKPDNLVARRAGTVVNFECKGRYPLYLSGEYSITCLDTGSWSDNPLECEEEDPEAKCPASPKGINAAKVQGMVKPRRVGGITMYQCKKKFPYAVGGQSKLTCQEDGTYDGEPLECSEIETVVVPTVCPPPCRMFCPLGFVVDDNGCETCACKACPLVKCNRKMCPNGYVVDDYGCDTCECRPCPVTRCKMFCDNGFKKDSAGCDTCECEAGKEPQCGEGFELVNNACYAFVPKLGYFKDANKACQDMGAYLVNIDSQEEQDAVYAKAKEWTKGMNIPGEFKPVWIGGYRWNAKSPWLWSGTNNDMTYSNFGNCNDKCNKKHYTVLSTVNGKWSEVFIKWAKLKRPAICEKDWVDSEEVGVVSHDCGGDGFELLDGSCYKFIADMDFYIGAQAVCEELGAYLLAIESLEEQNNLYAKFKIWIETEGLDIVDNKVWIGGERKNKKSPWMWYGTESEFEYDNLLDCKKNKQPNCSKRTALAMDMKTGKWWYVFKSWQNRRRPFVCEKGAH
jgi:hypothetical protein